MKFKKWGVAPTKNVLIVLDNPGDTKVRLNIFLTYTAPEVITKKHFQRKNHLII